MFNDDFVWIPAAATNVAETIRKEWAKLGQLPPDQDPKILANRQRILALTNRPLEVADGER